MAETIICRCRKRLASSFEVAADLEIPLGQSPVTVLFGASGSGKTTLLRMLAGLDMPDEGEILFRDTVWYSSSRRIHLPPQQRGAGFLFQEYALFPHLTVAQNVGYAALPHRASELLGSFHLQEFSSRLPRTLSGGQQQRTALARALAAGPELLLLDEPLSALDAPGRARMRQELRRILVESGVPAILVTHDRMEAIALGDWMAVLSAGRIRQCGPVQEVFRHPADAEVAATVGVENVLPARVACREAGLLVLEVGAVRLQAVDSGESGPVFACIHAEDVAVVRAGSPESSVRNRLAAHVRFITLEGALARVELDCGFPLVAVITAQSAGELGLKPGDAVWAAVKTTSVHITPGSASNL